VRVTRVELKSIDPPRSIQEAMEQQMRADRAKRAAVLQAEGERQAAILRAEGAKQAAILQAEAERQSNVLRAQGEKEARALRAEGEAQALANVFAAIDRVDAGVEAALGYKYLEVLPQLAAGPASKLIVVPAGAAQAMGAVAGLGTALQQLGTEKASGAAPGEDGMPPMQPPTPGA
jgi:regulator of protease activity HflC (stomatin/prohibitin superfamily)